jgi:hypothetical protein
VRIRIPTQIEGVARVVALSPPTDVDLAAADARRPAVVERFLSDRDRAPLVFAALALLLLVAASGSFLMLAHRVSRDGLRGGS